MSAASLVSLYTSNKKPATTYGCAALLRDTIQRLEYATNHTIFCALGLFSSNLSIKTYPQYAADSKEKLSLGGQYVRTLRIPRLFLYHGSPLFSSKDGFSKSMSVICLRFVWHLRISRG